MRLTGMATHLAAIVLMGHALLLGPAAQAQIQSSAGHQGSATTPLRATPQVQQVQVAISPPSHWAMARSPIVLTPASHQIHCGVTAGPIHSGPAYHRGAGGNSTLPPYGPGYYYPGSAEGEGFGLLHYPHASNGLYHYLAPPEPRRRFRSGYSGYECCGDQCACPPQRHRLLGHFWFPGKHLSRPRCHAGHHGWFPWFGSRKHSRCGCHH